MRDAPEERRLVTEGIDLVLRHAFEAILAAETWVVTNCGRLDTVGTDDGLWQRPVLGVAAAVLGGKVDAHEEGQARGHEGEAEADGVAHPEFGRVLGAVDERRDNAARVTGHEEDAHRRSSLDDGRVVVAGPGDCVGDAAAGMWVRDQLRSEQIGSCFRLTERCRQRKGRPAQRKTGGLVAIARDSLLETATYSEVGDARVLGDIDGEQDGVTDANNRHPEDVENSALAEAVGSERRAERDEEGCEDSARSAASHGDAGYLQHTENVGRRGEKPVCRAEVAVNNVRLGL